MDFGAEAIHKCHYCQQVIKGDKYRESNVVTFISDFFNDSNNFDVDCMNPNSEIYVEKCKQELVEIVSVPAFCTNYGKTFSWTILRLKKRLKRHLWMRKKRKYSRNCLIE